MEKDAAGVEEAAEVVGLVSVLRGRWKDATAELAAKLKDKEATNAALLARIRKLEAEKAGLLARY